MIKPKRNLVETEATADSLKKQIVRKMTVLLKKDPEGTSEFLKKLEMRLWEVRLEQAGTDTRKLSKLLAVLFGRMGPLHKKLKLNTRDKSQLSLILE